MTQPTTAANIIEEVREQYERACALACAIEDRRRETDDTVAQNLCAMLTDILGVTLAGLHGRLERALQAAPAAPAPAPVQVSTPAPPTGQIH